MPILLVIDDDPTMLRVLSLILHDQETTVLTALTGKQGLELAAKHDPDVILLDINLPDVSGLDAFRQIQELNAKIPVIFVTGMGTTETAIEAMKLGAFEYLVKDDLLEPAQAVRLRALVRRACEISRFMRVPAVMPGATLPAGPSDALIGRCPAMQEVYKAIGRVAPQDVTVLIRGETGTGKELVARAVYHHSRRAHGPFLAVNCAAIPETLLESELFGHEKGAFTGAERKRIGKLEQCSGGTLFLDEVGDMTPLTQAKILRALQDQQFERVGGNETIHTDVRLIAATNQNLEELAAAGRYRSDLYYRLGVFTLWLPPLRERGSDLRLLVEQFLPMCGPAFGKDVREVAPEAFALLERHSWPGNVRELQGVIKQALLQATGPRLLPEFLPAYLRSQGSPRAVPSTADSQEWRSFIRQRLKEGSTNLYAEAMAVLERCLLTEVLKATNANQVRAAKTLGISRNRLRNKLQKLSISIRRSTFPEEDHAV